MMRFLRTCLGECLGRGRAAEAPTAGDGGLRRAILSRRPEAVSACAASLGSADLAAALAANRGELMTLVAHCPEGYARLCEVTTPAARLRAVEAGGLEALGRAAAARNVPMVERLSEEIPASLQGAYWGTPEGQEKLLEDVLRGGGALRRCLQRWAIDRPLGPDGTFLPWQAYIRDAPRLRA